MKNSRYKIYYIIAIIAFLTIIILFGAILPLINGIKAKSANTATMLSQTDNLYSDWFALKTAEKTLKKIDENRLENIFLNPDQSLNFIVAIENIIKNNNLYHEIKILTLSPASPKSDKNEPAKPTLPFQITIWGTFPNFMRFLNNLENLPYFVEIDSLQINRLSETDPIIKSFILNTGDIKATLNIKVYAK